MSIFLRLAGITNAAAWFGAAMFFTVAVWPAFYSPEMLKILPLSHAGAAAQVVRDGYFVLQFWCGGIALVLFVLEWLYAGKSLRRWIVVVVTGIVGLGLVMGVIIEPKLKRLHLETYGVRSTPQQREQASRSFRVWQSVMHMANLVVIAGLWVYVWETNNAVSSTRFVSSGKFRG